MVTLCVNGEDKSRQVTDWDIKYNKARCQTELICHFHSGKKYHFPLDECEVTPVQHITDALLKRKGSTLIDSPERLTVYGEKYAVVYYQGNDTPYVMKMAGLEILQNTEMKTHPVYTYLQQVAHQRVHHATGGDQGIAENVVRQLDKVVSHPDTALNAYCSGKIQKRLPPGNLIFPFGINESQLRAVEQAFSSQVSVIEGPPGTGKTQTILNIIANILIQNRTVAILSNNNTAVANVYEKLEGCGLGYIIAKLGSVDNKNAFFEKAKSVPSLDDTAVIDINEIDGSLADVKKCLHAINQRAMLKAEIDELNVELNYLKQWQNENPGNNSFPVERYGLSPAKTTDFMAYINYLSDRRIGIRNRLTLLFGFRVFRVKPLESLEKRQVLFTSLQTYYYEEKLREKNHFLDECEQMLRQSDFDTLLSKLTSGSMSYLRKHLTETISDTAPFDAKKYRREFNEFIRRYPVIGSSTHSIINSVGDGALLDYVIIDEASQQDIVPGVLGLGCARNVIVVGDRKQLAHVPTILNISPPSEYYDCDKYSLLDSLILLFRDSVPLTLLKEHYRCHPKIIQFCNKQFYDNALIPLTRDAGEQAFNLIITGKGNHMRNFSNLRELESIEGVEIDEKNSVGAIAPYNAQVNLSSRVLPDQFVKSTVHKFQGRECDEIIFSTVLDKKRISQDPATINFVDNPNLINVAVSRARKKFTLVTGDGVFDRNGKHIPALIRYIKYYANDDHIHLSPVVSAFDLLYREYDESLEKLNARLNPEDSRFKSEQIVACLLRDILSQQKNQDLMFHSQILLSQLVSTVNVGFTERELAFIRHHSSCDFVLYYKIGKQPLGVVEVDGGYHMKESQIERDNLKNEILEKSGLPLLRLRTIDSDIMGKTERFITRCLSKSESPDADPHLG